MPTASDKAVVSDVGGSVKFIFAGDTWLEPEIEFGADITFDVAEGKTVYAKKALSGSGDAIKTGLGTFQLQSNCTRTGALYVNEGIVNWSGGESVCGSTGLFVGDGVHDAEFRMLMDWSWDTTKAFVNNATAPLIVQNHGVFDWQHYCNNVYHSRANFSPLTIYAGGAAYIGSHVLVNNDNAAVHSVNGILEGLAGGQFRLKASTLSFGSTEETRMLAFGFTGQFQWVSGSVYAKIGAVANEGLEVDLHISGPLGIGWDARDGYDFIGTGTVKLSGSSIYGGHASQGFTRVQSGRLFVDNETGSGTGYSKVEVSAGATLGGTGFIGGFADDMATSAETAYAATACVVVNGAAGNPGVLAPGSYEDDTNKRIYGTLTVGSEDQASSVTMNANTKLAFEAGKGGATGLKVYGPLTLGSNVTLDVNVRDDAKTGDYVLVSATGGITGDYTLTGNASAAKVVRSENQILLKIRKGLIITFR